MVYQLQVQAEQKLNRFIIVNYSITSKNQINLLTFRRVVFDENILITPISYLTLKL